MSFDRSVRDGARERQGSAARAARLGAAPGVVSVLRVQRSLGNRGVGRILARDTPEAGAADPTEVALSPQEMCDRVLAERGMASRVTPHRVAARVGPIGRLGAYTATHFQVVLIAWLLVAARARGARWPSPLRSLAPAAAPQWVRSGFRLSEGPQRRSKVAFTFDVVLPIGELT